MITNGSIEEREVDHLRKCSGSKVLSGNLLYWIQEDPAHPIHHPRDGKEVVLLRFSDSKVKTAYGK